LPDRYTPELAAAILKVVSEGSTLRRVCRDEGIPESTVRTWARDDKQGFAAKSAQARAMQVDALADELIEVAYRDDLDPQDKRVRCDTIKWTLSKLAPKRYGDRLLVAGDAENPILHLHKQVSVSDLNDDQIDALMVFCDRMLLEHEPAGTGEDRRDSGNGGALTLLEPPQYRRTI
jgi:transposase-like protein